MQITWRDKENIELKTKGVTVTTAGKVKVNDFVIGGPGEYEVAGVEIFVIGEGIYRLRIEDVIVAYFDPSVKKISDTELKELNDVTIVIICVGVGYLDAKSAASMVKSIEPNLVVPIGAEDRAEFCEVLGAATEPVATYKVTKQQIGLLEGQTVILLSSSK